MPGATPVDALINAARACELFMMEWGAGANRRTERFPVNIEDLRKLAGPPPAEPIDVMAEACVLLNDVRVNVTISKPIGDRVNDTIGGYCSVLVDGMEVPAWVVGLGRVDAVVKAAQLVASCLHAGTPQPTLDYARTFLDHEFVGAVIIPGPHQSD